MIAIIRQWIIKFLQSLAEKLEKELRDLERNEPGQSSSCKLLFRSDRGDVRIPVSMKQEREEKVAKYLFLVDGLVQCLGFN